MLGPPAAEALSSAARLSSARAGGKTKWKTRPQRERERYDRAHSGRAQSPRDPGSSGSQSPVTGERFRDDAVASTVLRCCQVDD